MKKGLLKKITACVLAVVMVGTLASSNGIVKGENTTGSSDEPVNNENIELTKTASWDDENQEATITLESYTTGTVVGKAVPTDIVLVLDVSGSMEDDLTSETEEYQYLPYDGITVSDAYRYTNRGRRLYYFDGTDYHQVTIDRENNNSWWEEPDYTYDIYYGRWNNAQYLVEYDDGSGVIKELITNGLYTREYVQTSPGESKISALKKAVNSFIDATAENNKGLEQEQQSRVSIVKFADDSFSPRGKDDIGNDFNREDYNRTQVMRDFTYVNDSNLQDVKGTVDSIRVAGATSADYGLELANDVIDGYGNLTSARDDANKVVIMFTDGEPNHSNGFSGSVASNAINNAKTLKDKGVTLYTIGVFEDANPSDIYGDFNKYMHAVSSNYPSATSRYSYGNWIVTLGDRNEDGKNYYKSASNSSELGDIFDDIQDDIESGAKLDGTAYVSDFISEEFKIPNNSDITVYTSNYLGKNSLEKWSEKEKFTEANVEIINNEVRVSNFNYTDNMVLDRSDGSFSGKKLIIEIKLKPKDGFIGGNGVSTNVNDSASLKGTDGVVHENTTVNHIDIPLKFGFDSQDAVIYVGSNWNEIQRFIGASIDEDKVSYKNDRNTDGDGGTGRVKTYTIDGVNNKYVNITYTIKDSNDKLLGTYVIDAGATKGHWDGANPDINSEDLRDCTTYKVEAKVTPIQKDASEGNNSGIVAKEENYTSDNASLHIMNPEITLTDEHIFLGNTADLKDRVTLEDNWEHDSTAKDDLPSNYKIEGTNKFTYEYSRDSGSADLDTVETDDDYTPTKAEDATFHVTVKNGEEPITDATKFNSGHTVIKDDSCIYKNHFTVYVKAGTIEIFKELNLNEMKVDETDGDPIFTYKIEREVTPGNYETVGYEYVKLTKDGDTWVQTRKATFDNLPVGNYIVTEETPLRYEFMNGYWKYQGNSSTQPISDAIAEFSISDKNSYVELHYTNKVKSDDFDSDNGILINKFVIGDNGNLDVEKDKLDK